MPRPLLSLLALLALFAAGCGSEPPAVAGTPATSPAPLNDKPTEFQPLQSGKLAGLVTWTGSLPTLTPVIDIRPRGNGTGHDTRTFRHPYAPSIDRFTRALGGAVVYLREVNTTHAKSWDLPPVSVEIRDSQLVVKQGDRLGRAGFLRRGDSVTMQSAEPVHHVLRGRGAAFFSLPFPDPNQPLARTFDTFGRVELTSAAGYYWQAADLFVCDHPYYTVCDADGRFEFTQVPAGKYDLVAWHPNWVVTKSERNPESGLQNRLYYAPPLESSRPVMVVAGRVTLANLTLPK